ncbi:ExeA family protein [Halorhodospira neutriphila]|uniref:AAA family ATPase n=1 Tax=Halorhodospira neutriphila TaxID=168379 RepID=A0ABS1E803_9GAMM|nr:AAA family ATPase [Halorhodospira neutriphila]MBK1727337.1 AAA family ATPase [Halorhodospira neutriphila]
MYLEHFGLEAYPFQLTPNTEYFYTRAGHRQALEVVRTALANGEGFIRLTGEVGTGKTLLCRMLRNELGDDWVVAAIPNPALDPESLRQVAARELGAVQPGDGDAHALLTQLHDRLQALAAEGRRAVLLIDEAQVMPDESLEMVRLLTNLEGDQDKLLHVVLVGQPELDERLAQPHLRQLRQRCSFAHRLEPLPRRMVDDYLQHRLQTAGYRGRALFSRRAVRLIGRAAEGVPRLVNTLAHKGLLVAYGEGEQRVRRRHIARAIADTDAVARRGSALGRLRRRLQGRREAAA